VKIALGVVIGAVLGYAYHYFVGCRTGSCPITANWWASTAYGALLGAMVAA